jgi:hypothetical protein
VLVDEAAETRDGVSATRKVAVSRPRSAMLYSAGLASRSAWLGSGLAEPSSRLSDCSPRLREPVSPIDELRAGRGLPFQRLALLGHKPRVLERADLLPVGRQRAQQLVILE